jgi:hypothetical protein
VHWSIYGRHVDSVYGILTDAAPLSIAKAAGEAIASVEGASSIDAAVMASAAQRGDIVYTSGRDDLERLAAYFLGVRILSV